MADTEEIMERMRTLLRADTAAELTDTRERRDLLREIDSWFRPETPAMFAGGKLPYTTGNGRAG